MKETKLNQNTCKETKNALTACHGDYKCRSIYWLHHSYLPRDFAAMLSWDVAEF